MTNRTVRFLVCSAIGLALAGSGRAFAQDNPPAEGGAAPPPAAGGEATPGVAATPAPAPAGAGNPTDITLKAGQVGAEADVAINLTKELVGKPFSIVPNVYYGVTDALSVGLASNPGSEVFQSPAAGNGLCLAGTSGGCGKIYSNISLDALFSFLRSGTMDLGVHGGLDTSFGDTTLLGVRVGVKSRMLAGPLILTVDPALIIGANHRSDGNKEALIVPVRAGFMATPQLNLGLSVAILGPLDGFGDSYAVPVGIGGTFAINNNIAARAQFTLDNLGGKVPDGAGRARPLALVRRRLPDVTPVPVQTTPRGFGLAGVFLCPVGDLVAPSRGGRPDRDGQGGRGEQEVQPRHPSRLAACHADDPDDREAEPQHGRAKRIRRVVLDRVVDEAADPEGQDRADCIEPEQGRVVIEAEPNPPEQRESKPDDERASSHHDSPPSRNLSHPIAVGR